MSNELDLLEAHLEESQHWADELVVIESPLTFTGIEKPMYFADNRERFERFDVKYLVTPPEAFEEIPRHFPEEDRRKWFQARRNNRDLNRRYHWDTVRADTDYVYYNDVDEFVCKEHGSYLRSLLEPKEYWYLSVSTRKFNFFVNARGSKQSQARITRSDMEDFIQQKGTPRTTTKEIGWHFTSCLHPEDLYEKYLGIYLHLGMTYDQIPSVETIRERLETGIEPSTLTPLYGGLKEVMPRDDMYWAPDFIRERPELFPWTDHQHEALNPGWRRNKEGWWLTTS
jgi:beta-1,4-mannosyl-glycoprotein beta-1,4-N-acetylglucosaminyltransferase